jgi:hypothetical protein
MMQKRVNRSATQLKKAFQLGAIATAITLGFSLSGAAIAHEEALNSGWCSGGQISILGQFKLNKTLLQQFAKESSGVCSQLKSCGQFDDEYGVAFRTAGALCHSFSEAELTYKNIGDHLSVRAIFHSPATMKNSEANHHDLYSFEQGLEFSCGLCELDNSVAKDEERAVESR